MEKVCIVFANAPRHMIMANVYFEYLDRNCIPYDIIYLDRYDEKEKTTARESFAIAYKKNNKFQKLLGFFKFGREATEILKQNKYGFVIVWGEYTAAFVSKVLKKYYPDRYCINVRDLNVGVRKILDIPLNSAILKARFVTVSSEKYIEKLTPKYKRYLFFHSYNQQIMDETLTEVGAEEERKNAELPIRVLFIGNIRFYDHLTRFIELIKNDKRYEFTVAGAGSDAVKEYVEKEQINNVFVHGAFPKEQTGRYLSKADVIYNLYGTEDINLRYALSNKLYYAVALEKPILVYKNTYMYEMAEKCGIAFPVDEYLSGGFGDSFFTWYMGRDIEKTKQKCQSMVRAAIQTQDNLRMKLDEVKETLLDSKE